ncbi:opaque-specific ABC transporter CDR3 [Cucurbitaria berberidis CBS 394.84]|uniref:Opaque-specific ABC transporter CDR3 n=1 Tax=Cucurbitaria berberidis CBS 394.84 TaxID=1168544 RepID=A0A9P4L472_9PLEO|nr:opaque-specific ABC transporter CDR3 [Cucurbitaria berberidis CBS 394.84]KAF1841024.1 opaque-specific ABC transporter CDR3 [Cucurbitaria berberidis CBS 394.84]
MSAAMGIAEKVDRAEKSLTIHTKPESSCDSEYGTRDEVIQDVKSEQEVAELVRMFTSQSQQQNLESPFTAEQNSRLDPKSDRFRARDWARSFYDLRYSSEGSIARVAGVAFRGLNVWGKGSPTDFQSTVGNKILKLPSLFGRGAQKVEILRDLEGLVLPGEQLCVLGPPGSGCSTLLKTIAGDTHGFKVNSDAYLNYQGIPAKDMKTSFRGEAIYTAEVDAHFSQLSVGDTLYFAARARAPRNIPGGVSRQLYAEHLRDVVMAMFGISHTINTQVGNDFVRGVSGGERKRVTIAEATLSFAPLQCWDNSTRGLDSANAVEFCKTLRTQCDVFGTSTCVAIYQAPQAAYDVFDKVVVLYEGRQIYFGPSCEARGYFESLGFECPASQTTPDFLTSMTSPSERRIRAGLENSTPRTSDDFARCWKKSPERQKLLNAIEEYSQTHPLKGETHEQFSLSRTLEKSRNQRQKSPYTLSYWKQVSLCMWREVQMLKNDPSVIFAMLGINFVEALIIASIFYNLPSTTASFFKRGAIVFMMVLLNAFASIIEIMSLYAKRTIVEKHNRYALYHPSAEALASMIIDIPYKIANAIFVNSTLYFMANLRREAGPFFFFLLVSFTMGLSMSMLFRLFASMTKTIAQALAPSSILLLALVLYSGFVIPIEYMRGYNLSFKPNNYANVHRWASWIRFINPVAYGFSNVMVNEFNGRTFECTSFVPSGPSYENVSAEQRACAVQGSVPGSNSVSGTTYVETAYKYHYSSRWPNYGVILAITVILFIAHLVMSEIVASERSKGEVLVFRRSKMQNSSKGHSADEETGSETAHQAEKFRDNNDSQHEVQKQVSIFHWEAVNYEIQIKGEHRKILDSVDGWIKPGTLTALMGVSGAGKTTLLDVLASRTTMGIISGNMLVDGRERDESFQRKTGYVMQQDIHLETSTVREALEFSALLRQPMEFNREERLAYVDHVIRLLDMEKYADAVVGIPGSGLNVEQRKRLTIGVELAARPKLLLFLDEPTSGLDSQTSWSICDLMEKLTRNGQAVLCTVHQPSSLLFQRFDRLLLLAKGGRTVYFGDIGSGSKTIVDYFARNGAPECPAGTNPAEYMLEAIGAAPGHETEIDWPSVWKNSKEYSDVQAELAKLRELSNQPSAVMDSSDASHQEFAAPFMMQLSAVALRCAQQYWRTPSYIYSKALLTVGSSLVIGLSFLNGENTIQGLQNQMFGVFIFLFVVIQLIYQILPMFISQRTLYEARERQSKTYAWQAFVLSNIVIEMAWNALMAIFCFICWYYPAGFYRNAEFTDSVHIRGFHAVLIVVVTFLIASSLAHLLIAGAPSEEIAAAFATLLSIMLYAFAGILAGPKDLPRFWIFMYRVNPVTYLVSSFMSTTLGQAPVSCAQTEFQTFAAPANQTCGQYMRDYIETAGGYLRDAQAFGQCQYCQMDSTNQFLQRINADWDTRWRDFGLLWVYVVFNAAAAVFLYWVFRVPKSKKMKRV